MTVVAIHQPNYIPWLGFFYKMMNSDVFVFLDNVHPSFGRGYGSRNRIWTPQGSMWLTVPYLKKGRRLQRICDIEIDKTSSWKRKHQNALRFSYSRASYFEKYIPFLDLYELEWSKLVELNKAIIKYIAEELNIYCKFFEASSLNVEGSSTDLLISICKQVGGDTYLSGSGGAKYQEVEKFERAGIRLEYSDFVHPTYPQVGKEFMPNLSIVDLLFNCGSDSRRILEVRKVDEDR